MKDAFIFLGLIVFISSCGERNILVENQWIIIDGTYKNRAIDFQTIQAVLFVDHEGNEIKSLDFSEGGRITLPGIHSPQIHAKWFASNDQIHFEIDSADYQVFTKHDLSMLEHPDSVTKAHAEIRNPKLEEIRDAFKVYDQSYRYYISEDMLVLESAATRIRAVRDRRVEVLMEPIRPK